jgi:uncharacterized membrane protein YhaH (DUF805 family)
MNLGESIEICMTKYSDFTGRAGRSEFWWFFVFNLLISSAVDIVGHSNRFSSLLSLALLLPDLAVGARRLHDVGRSGWWQLLMLTGIGFVPLLIFWAQESHQEENAYGVQVMKADGA